jgi:putative transposase
MLLRLAYLGITHAFALPRLLPGSDRDKGAEILALRHQLAVLHRHLSGQRVRFEPADRAWLAALLSMLPRASLHRLRLLVRPDTVLRWHRDLHAHRHAKASRPGRRGRPRTVRSIRTDAGAAPGRGESVLGIPASTRRAAHPRGESRRVDGLGDPA